MLPTPVCPLNTAQQALPSPRSRNGSRSVFLPPRKSRNDPGGAGKHSDLSSPLKVLNEQASVVLLLSFQMIFFPCGNKLWLARISNTVSVICAKFQESWRLDEEATSGGCWMHTHLGILHAYIYCAVSDVHERGGLDIYTPRSVVHSQCP